MRETVALYLFLIERFKLFIGLSDESFYICETNAMYLCISTFSERLYIAKRYYAINRLKQNLFKEIYKNLHITL